MATNYLRVERVREAHFYNQGIEVKPGEIIKYLYSPLDGLIGYNIRNFKSHKNPLVRDSLKREREKMYDESKEKVETLGEGLSAKFYLDDCTKRDFQVKPRTNYEIDLGKRPNIIILEDEGENRFVLREARNYEGEEFSSRFCRMKLNPHYKAKISIRDLAKKSRKDQGKNIVLFPESDLILSLEQLYAQDIVTRITPHIKIIGVEGNWLWYIRNFLDSIRDSHLDLNGLMKYVGTLHGLSLMDKIDSQVAHYCVNKGGKVVNVDPDFFTFTLNQEATYDLDWKGEFQKHMQELSVTKTRIEESKGMRNQVIRDVKNKMDGKTLLDYLPESLSNASSVKYLGIDNLFIE